MCIQDLAIVYVISEFLSGFGIIARLMTTLQRIH